MQDFDIAGTYDSMVPDAEVLSVVCEALTALDIGEFTIKVGCRSVLQLHTHPLDQPPQGLGRYL